MSKYAISNETVFWVDALRFRWTHSAINSRPSYL